MTRRIGISNEEIAQIRERAKKATEGPWYSADGVYVVANVVGDSQEWDADYIAECGPDGGATDADFIANARSDIPKLLAEIERLKKERDELWAHFVADNETQELNDIYTLEIKGESGYSDVISEYNGEEDYE